MGPAAMPSHAIGEPADEAAVPLTGWRGTVRRSSIVAAVAIIGYRLTVDYGYRILVAEPFAYQGFHNSPTVGSIVLSWVFLLSLLPLLVRVFRAETLSANVTTVLALISLVPTTTLIAHDPRYPVAYVVLIYIYWLLFLLASAFLPAMRPFSRPLRSDVPHVTLLVMLSATILYLSWRHTGFRLHFGLFDIYDLRAEAREYRVATIIGYFATIADNALPVLVAFYLRRRWVAVAALAGVVILFNYGISATKQILFLLMFAVASVAMDDRARLNRSVLAALFGIITLCLIEKQVFGTGFLTVLSIYRVLMIPAQLHWVHYDFFQNNDMLYLTQSALRFFFESPYRENIQFILGEYYIGQFTARANNGLFSDGYMNFGAVSVLFYPLLVVFVLKLVEGAAEGLSASVRLVLTVALSFIFLGLPLPTALLSAGVGVLVILLSTLPRPNRKAPAIAGTPA
jgi:hypothetical protein